MRTTLKFLTILLAVKENVSFATNSSAIQIEERATGKILRIKTQEVSRVDILKITEAAGHILSQSLEAPVVVDASPCPAIAHQAHTIS